MSWPAFAGDRSPHAGPSGWRPRSSAHADRSRSGLDGHLSPLSSEADDDHSGTLVALTGMSLSGLSWPSSGTSMASPLLVARLLLHRSLGSCRRPSSAFHLPSSPCL